MFNLIEKKRQWENLRITVVLWLKESIQPITLFIDSLQQFVEESKSTDVLKSKQLFICPVHLYRIKEFQIDKLSDALVARLRVGKEEKRKLVQNFYDLYDSTSNMNNTINRILEVHSDYNCKIDQLKRDWSEHYMKFMRQIKDFLIDKDTPDPERHCFMKIDSILTDFHTRVNDIGGICRRDMLQNFIQEVTDVFGKTYATERINQAVEMFNKDYVVYRHMESLHADTIRVCQTYIAILNPSKEHLSEVVSFYEQHKIKGIFSFSNKVV